MNRRSNSPSRDRRLSAPHGPLTMHPRGASNMGLGSQQWLPVEAAEVWLAFLRAEWDNARNVTAQHDRSLIDKPDLDSLTQNDLRRRILGAWRDPLLLRIPGDTRW